MFVEIGHNRGVPFQMYYDLHGTGEKKLLFIIGFATSLRAWDRQVEYFTQGKTDYQVLVVDNRGFGRSARPTGAWTFSIKEMAQDISEVIDKIGWEKYHVAGVSMGGMIAQELFFWHQHKILSMVLAVTHYGGPASWTPASGVWLLAKIAFKSKIQDKIPLILEMNFSQKYLKAPDKYGNTNQTNEQRLFDTLLARFKLDLTDGGEEYTKNYLWTVFGQTAAISTHFISNDRLATIKNSKIPLIICTGTDDHLVSPKNSYALKDYLEPTEFIEWKGAGHAVNEECFEEFNEAIIRNIDRAEKGYADSHHEQKEIAKLDKIDEKKNSDNRGRRQEWPSPKL